MDNRKTLGQLFVPICLETLFYMMAVMTQNIGAGKPCIAYQARQIGVIFNIVLGFSIGAALAGANAIMTGWRVGAKEFDACDRGTKKAALIGIVVAIAVESAFALCAEPIMSLFTDDPEMVAIVAKLLAIDIVLEIGRATNLVFGNALKTSGDALFPVIIGAIFMFLCTVCGTYFFGIHLELMVVGAYIALALDECTRAIAMFLRWQSGKWREKGIV